MKCDDCDGNGWIIRRDIVGFHFDDIPFNRSAIYTQEIVGYDNEYLLGRVSDTEVAILCPLCDGFGVEWGYQVKLPLWLGS